MTKLSPTISIVTVCRNAAKTIKTTIESILDQSDDAVEYIVVDGASTDNTLDIIKLFPKINKVISEPDDGIADAFNKGIALATNDVVGLINADDKIAAGAISHVRQYFSDHPETGVVHGDVLLYENERLVKRIRPSKRWWYPWRLVLFNHPATFIRRTIYEKHGCFNTSYKLAMDVELFLRLKRHGVTIDYLPMVLADMQSGGVSSDQATKGFREVQKALNRHGFSRAVSLIQYFCKVILHTALTLRRRFH